MCSCQRSPKGLDYIVEVQGMSEQPIAFRQAESHRSLVHHSNCWYAIARIIDPEEWRKVSHGLPL
jgi:hypothetical protein